MGLVEFGLPEVLGIVAVDNARSRRVLEKAGFLRIGERWTVAPMQSSSIGARISE